MKELPPPSRMDDFTALVNPPLAASAAAEALAGTLLGGSSPLSPAPYLIACASALLFAAGSAFGHYFDRAQDENLHPDRPLPAGRTDPSAVWRGAWVLLIAGLVLPSLLGRDPSAAAIGVGVLVVLYSSLTKTMWGVGFVTLAAARGLNLILGLSVSDYGPTRFAYAAIPVTIYALGWALLRASGQPGAPRATGFVALVHLVGALSIVIYQAQVAFAYRMDALPFFVALLVLVVPRAMRAVMDPRPWQVSEAVQYGFLGLTLLEATLAAGFSGIVAGTIPATVAVFLYALLRRWPVPLARRPR